VQRSPKRFPDIALSPLVMGNPAPIIQALLSSTRHGILMTDQSGTDILCNRRFGELFGLDTELIVKSTRAEVRKMALERVKDPQGFLRVMEKVYGDPDLIYEDEIELAAPTNRILRRYTGPVYDAEGKNLGRVWTFDDITEMRRLQAEVAAQESIVQGAKLGAVGMLAASIAHDIRNILTPLKLELAMAGPDSPLASARAHVDRLSALAHRLLALSQPVHREHGAVEIGPLIEGIRPLLQHQADMDGVEIRTNWPEHMPAVLGDRSRLEHLFINLMLNGLTAMSARGGRLELTAKGDGEYVIVDISDSGTGIAPMNLERIFDPFFTTRSTGSGLGLCSVKRIAEEHSGDVTVRSTPGHGACFSVRLPAYAVAANSTIPKGANACRAASCS
jgi:signal transduction histidine kinase